MLQGRRSGWLVAALITATLGWSCKDTSLVSIAITPGDARVRAAATQQFTATGTYSDGKTRDISQEVVWASSKTAVATVDATGLATGVGSGATTITATLGDVETGVALEVVSIASLAIAPGSPSLNPGSTQALTLTATYGDGTTADVTSMATWTSSAPAVVRVSNDAGTKGQATASMITGGSALVVASVGGLSATTTVSVSSAVLLSIAVTPFRVTVPDTFDVRLAAMGTYDDGTVRNISNTVTWASPAPGVASVDATGKVHGTAVGDTTITATYGMLHASATVTVSAETLTGIRLAPVNAVLAPGKVADYTAFGDFSSGSVVDLTESVTWASDTAATASITAGGQVTAVADGTTQITAAFGGTTSPAQTLTVTTGSTAYAERRIPFEFEDITGTGTLVTSGDDAAAALAPVNGLSFSYFGTSYTLDQLYPCTNGFVRFGSSSTSTTSPGFPFNSTTLAAYWADLVTAVYAKVDGTPGSQRLIVQWTGGVYSSAGRVDVEAVLYEGTNAIDVRFFATEPQLGSGMAIGLGAGTVYTEHGLGSRVALPGTAIRFVP